MITADDLARLAKGATQGPKCGAGVEGCTCTMDRADGKLREVLVNSLPEICAAMRVAEAAEVLNSNPVFRGSVTMGKLNSALTALRLAAGTEGEGLGEKGGGKP